jgi:hypothetical protein
MDGLMSTYTVRTPDGSERTFGDMSQVFDLIDRQGVLSGTDLLRDGQLFARIYASGYVYAFDYEV